jgi:hypothetical protein
MVSLHRFFLPWQCARWEKPLGLLQLIERLYFRVQSSPILYFFMMANNLAWSSFCLGELGIAFIAALNSRFASLRSSGDMTAQGSLKSLNECDPSEMYDLKDFM